MCRRASHLNPVWRYREFQSSAPRRRSEPTTCFSSDSSRRKNTSWNSGLLRSSLTRLLPTATRLAPPLPFLLRQGVRVRRPRFCSRRPVESSRDSRTMRFVERPELALGDHGQGPQQEAPVVQPLQLECLPRVTLSERDLPAPSDDLRLACRRRAISLNLDLFFHAVVPAYRTESCTGSSIAGRTT